MKCEQINKPEFNWPDPTPEMLKTPEFEAIWQCIKNWDIEVVSGDGYSSATGNHVRAILDALSQVKKGITGEKINGI